MKNQHLPLNLQFFGPGEGDGNGEGGTPQNQNQNQNQNTQVPEIDYEKLSSIIAGKQTATEESVLKGYFKQQGLSKEEMEQAINTFKQQRAASQPDVGKLQSDAQEARNAALNSKIENKALLMHDELGIDLKTVPYVLKLADVSNVVVDGAINDENLKEALNKVLEDVPQLKHQQEQSTQGFRQVGAAQQQTAGQEGTPGTKTVPTKRWNRFNN